MRHQVLMSREGTSILKCVHLRMKKCYPYKPLLTVTVKLGF